MVTQDTWRFKYTFTTHAVPLSAMVGLTTLTRPPRAGDLVAAQVLSLGKHTTIEDRTGVTYHLFPGDRIIGAFGNRYATDQYEGYVPTQVPDEFDLLSIGGVCGHVASRHDAMTVPTRLRFLGVVSDARAQPLNLSQFRLPHRDCGSTCEVILVVGASMNSGKTTTVGTLVRALSGFGYTVCAAKVTGTAAGKDGRYFSSCGAARVLDFTDVGHASTYLLSLHELLDIYTTLLASLQHVHPDYIVIEVADGIFQRETRMLLESIRFRSRINHVFFAANDSLSAECGVRHLRDMGLPVRATSGMVTQSPLASREAEEATGLPCMSIPRLLSDETLELLGLASSAHPAAAAAAARALHPANEQHAPALVEALQPVMA